MHYLEDDLELLQTIPEELKRRSYEMRELDQQAEKLQSEIKEESRDLFDNFGRIDAIEKERCYGRVKEGYQEIREIREEKSGLCNYLHIMLEKYQKRLEKDLAEFKMELEADSPGITATIEKELLESILEQRKREQEQEERRGSMPPPSSTASRANGEARQSRIGVEETRTDEEAPPVKRKASRTIITTDQPPGSSFATATSPAMSSSAVGMNLPTIFTTSIGRSGPSSPSAMMPTFASAQESQYGRPVKLTSRVQQLLKANRWTSATPSSSSPRMGRPSPSQQRRLKEMEDVYTTGEMADRLAEDAGEEEDDEEEQGIYCICQSGSHGEMVLCDNANVIPISLACQLIKCPNGEWFHYACVGITEPPEGAWYCPRCTKVLLQLQPIIIGVGDGAQTPPP